MTPRSNSSCLGEEGPKHDLGWVEGSPIGTMPEGLKNMTLVHPGGPPSDLILPSSGRGTSFIALIPVHRGIGTSVNRDTAENITFSRSTYVVGKTDIHKFVIIFENITSLHS